MIFSPFRSLSITANSAWNSSKPSNLVMCMKDRKGTHRFSFQKDMCPTKTIGADAGSPHVFPYDSLVLVEDLGDKTI